MYHIHWFTLLCTNRQWNQIALNHSHKLGLNGENYTSQSSGIKQWYTSIHRISFIFAIMYVYWIHKSHTPILLYTNTNIWLYYIEFLIFRLCYNEDIVKPNYLAQTYENHILHNKHTTIKESAAHTIISPSFVIVCFILACSM